MPPHDVTGIVGTNPGKPAGTVATRPRVLSPTEAKAAMDRFRTLCTTTGDHRQELDELSESLAETGYAHEMFDVLHEVVFGSGANDHTGALWMRRIVNSRGWRRTYPEALEELCERGEIGRGAVLELLEYASRKGKKPLIKQIRRKHQDWLLAHNKGWSLLSWGLANSGDYKACLRWTSGWEDRKETDLLVLYAIATSLRALGREQAAKPVIERALNIPEAWLKYPLLGLWKAAEEALADQTDTAAETFERLGPSGWDEDTFCAYYLVRGVIRVRQAEPSRRRSAYRAAYDRLRDRFRRVPVHRRALPLRRLYRRCLWRMSMDARRPGRALVAGWKAADSWLTLVPLLAVPGLQLIAPIFVYRRATNLRGQQR